MIHLLVATIALCLSKKSAAFLGESTLERQSPPRSLLHCDFSFLSSNEYSRPHASSNKAAQTFSLTSRYLERFFELPIIIFSDAILPGQTLHFSSADPKFDALIQYVLSSETTHSQEIGIVGMNPQSKLPLNIGVTAPIFQKDLVFGLNKNSERVLATSLKGERRFKILGELRMDPSQSFYLAEVEVVDKQLEYLPKALEDQAQKMHNSLPSLVQKWVESLIETEKLTPAGVSQIVQEIGPMPKTLKERAIWVGALVNPILPLELCHEIRPAMLACRNNHDRMCLASEALQSSIDTLWREKR